MEHDQNDESKKHYTQFKEKEIFHKDDIYVGRAHSVTADSASVDLADLDPEKPFIDAMFVIIHSSIPVCMNLLFEYLTETLNLIFIGSMNDENELSIYSLAQFYLGMTGLMGIVGLPGGIDTLCSSAYGANNYSLVSIYCTIGLMINFLYVIVIFVPCAFLAKGFFILLGQSPEFSDQIALFVKLCIPMVIINGFYMVLSRYIQAMKYFNINMIVTFVSLILHPLWLYIWMFQLNFKLYGVIFAYVCSDCINLGLTLYYIYYSHVIPSETRPSLSRKNFNIKYLKEYLSLGIKSFTFYFLEALAFESMILISSFLSKIDIATNIILINFTDISFLIGQGIGSTVCSYVGNSIGAGDSRVVRKYASAGLLLDVCIGIIIGFLAFTFWKQIAFIYTTKMEIVNNLEFLIKLYSIYCVFDLLGITISCICEGLGRQGAISKVCFILMYCFGIPLILFIAFYLDYGLYGMWIGLCISGVVLFLGYLLVYKMKSVEDTIEDFQKIHKELEN